MKGLITIIYTLMLGHLMAKNAPLMTMSDFVSEPKVLDLNNNENWNVKFRVSESVKSTLFIYNKELEVVKKIESPGYQDKPILIWDGLNENGKKVSSGLYFYRVQVLTESGEKFGHDLSLRGTGLDVKSYWPKLNQTSKTVDFKLSSDALVRLRVGLEHGGLISTLAEWVPVFKNKPSIPWDGWDQNRVKNYYNETNLKFDLAAISLPENLIYVKSHDDQPSTYLGTRWLSNAYAFHNNTKNLNLKVFSQLSKKQLPEQLSVEIKTSINKDENHHYLVNRENDKLEIIVPEISKEEQNQQAYEAVIFCNGIFIEEIFIKGRTTQYKIPFAQFEKGSENTLMVNVILGSSRIGTTSLKFKVL